MDTIANIIGINGLKSVLNYAHLQKYIDNFPPYNYELEIPIEELQSLFCSLYELFGQKGAHSLQIRCGREALRIGIEERSSIAKALKLAARLLPETMKIRLALERVQKDILDMMPTELGKSRFELLEEDDCFLYTDRENFESEGITSQVPVCGVIVGNLSYIIEWITGHPHDIEEIECRAMGHPADVIRVSKTRKE
ncbi:MAG: hypothetical protein HXS40_08315 [Theionarchaea archaeon]|nr:hypothetical protein [Theionarchaea archaeon]